MRWMARDFLHTEALIDAVLRQIETHGPATWFERGNRECLKALAFGDFMDLSLIHILITSPSSRRGKCSACGVTGSCLSPLNAIASMSRVATMRRCV